MYAYMWTLCIWFLNTYILTHTYKSRYTHIHTDIYTCTHIIHNIHKYAYMYIRALFLSSLFSHLSLFLCRFLSHTRSVSLFFSSLPFSRAVSSKSLCQLVILGVTHARALVLSLSLLFCLSLSLSLFLSLSSVPWLHPQTFRTLLLHLHPNTPFTPPGSTTSRLYPQNLQPDSASTLYLHTLPLDSTNRKYRQTPTSRLK